MHVSAFVDKGELFLALSRRLIGELIVYEGNRRPSSVVHIFKRLLLCESRVANSFHVSQIATIGSGNEKL